MEKEDLVSEMSDFICDNGLWQDFLDKLKGKGYTEEELEELDF